MHSGKSKVQRVVQKAETVRVQAKQAINQPQIKIFNADQLVSNQMSEFIPEEGTTFTFCQGQENLTKNLSVFRFDAFWKI